MRLFPFKRKSKHKNRTTTFPSRWEGFTTTIKEQWEQTGANVKVYKFRSIGEAHALFPKSSAKNEIFVGLAHWEEKDSDIVFVTRYNLHLEYPLQRHVDKLTEMEMSLFLPTEDTICKKCGSKSTFINLDQLCFDCDKKSIKSTQGFHPVSSKITV